METEKDKAQALGLALSQIEKLPSSMYQIANDSGVSCFR